MKKDNSSETERIAVRSDLDVKSSEELRDILDWLGSDTVTFAIKFCIHQVWLGLNKKEWTSVTED